MPDKQGPDNRGYTVIGLINEGSFCFHFRVCRTRRWIIDQPASYSYTYLHDCIARALPCIWPLYHRSVHCWLPLPPFAAISYYGVLPCHLPSISSLPPSWVEPRTTSCCLPSPLFAASCLLRRLPSPLFTAACHCHSSLPHAFTAFRHHAPAIATLCCCLLSLPPLFAAITATCLRLSFLPLTS